MYHCPQLHSVRLTIPFSNIIKSTSLVAYTILINEVQHFICWLWLSEYCLGLVNFTKDSKLVKKTLDTKNDYF